MQARLLSFWQLTLIESSAKECISLDYVIRTNNAAESFHAHLNGQFYSHHPTIFVLLDVLKKLQATTYVKARALLRPSNTNSSTKNYAQKQYEKYRNGDITRASLITAMGYKFKALN